MILKLDYLQNQKLMKIKLAIKLLFLYIKTLKILTSLHLIDYYISVRLLKRKVIVRKVNSYPMLLPFYEEGISRYLLIKRIREVPETSIIKEIVKPGMCILEIGSNIGYYTILMGKLIGKNGRIFAYEPYNPNFNVLMRNVKLNNLSSIIEANNCAVSDTTGIQKFYLNKASNLHSLINYSKRDNKTKYIDTKTLDIREILIKSEKKIDLIRMDIEGHERTIFKKLDKDLIGHLPQLIFFEIHPIGDIDPDPTFTEPLKNMLNLGYVPEIIVSSFNPSAYSRFKKLNYYPFKKIGRNFLYNKIKAEDLLKIAARRPKMTRAILLKRNVLDS